MLSDDLILRLRSVQTTHNTMLYEILLKAKFLFKVRLFLLEISVVILIIHDRSLENRCFIQMCCLILGLFRY